MARIVIFTTLFARLLLPHAHFSSKFTKLIFIWYFFRKKSFCRLGIPPIWHITEKTFFVKMLINVLKYHIKLSLVNLDEKWACGSKMRANIVKIKIHAIPPPLIKQKRVLKNKSRIKNDEIAIRSPKIKPLIKNDELATRTT